MLINLWRYAHFALALSSCLFVLLATLSGIVLALEPMERKLRPYRADGMEELSLAQALETLGETYDEILEVKVDKNDFVSASVFSMEEELSGEFYVDPRTGEKLGEPAAQGPFFAFVTNFHRSLFLKGLGRFFVGLGSFLLLLIVITGSILTIKRQKGLRKFFSKVVKEDFAQYWHVVLGRWSLIPIFILALTGVYLSLLRFEIVPRPQLASVVDPSTLSEPMERVPLGEFKVFRETPLREVRSLEFPFSPEVTDFYVLGLGDRELRIDQYTGEVVESLKYPWVNRMSELSFDLHTGNGSILWSLILLLASANILFFMYSGALISYGRLKAKIRNSHGADQAEYVILLGSENGSTKEFGKMLQESLLDLGQKVFMDDLDHVRTYAAMKHLVVITSTYGQGDPPANARHFLDRAPAFLSQGKFSFSVVGLGSLAYEKFCGFALKVDGLLQSGQGTAVLEEPFLIHNRSQTSFQKWAQKWGDGLGLSLRFAPKREKPQGRMRKLKIVAKKVVDDGHGKTFVLELKARFPLRFRAGDLLGVYPPGNPIKREYSMGRSREGNVLLSIKWHPRGVGSNYLFGLEKGDTIKGEPIVNKAFHAPMGDRPLLMVANGTGMAPYLGMLDGPGEKYLYWGGKNATSFGLYSPYLEPHTRGGLRVRTAFSRESEGPKYVQDLLQEEGGLVLDLLDAGGTLMICGSVRMQQGVLHVLGELCEASGRHLNHYQTKGQLRMDCY